MRRASLYKDRGTGTNQNIEKRQSTAEMNGDANISAHSDLLLLT